MNHINTSHQTLSAKQRNCNYRPDGAIAPHVLASTMEVDMQGRQVRGATATQRIQVGRLTVEGGSRLWFVQSKFDGRAYVVIIGTDGQYRCSSPDERVAAMCRAKLQASLKQAA